MKRQKKVREYSERKKKKKQKSKAGLRLRRVMRSFFKIPLKT